MKKLVLILFCFVLAAFALGKAYAQFAKPEYAIKYRKSVMFLMAQHFGRMGAVVKGKAPYDQEDFTHNAMVVETLSHLPWEAFTVPGTDKGDTTLKSSVFEQLSKFNANAQALEAQTAKLLSIAKSGDLNAIRAQFGEVGKSCKGCHEQFRTK